MKEKFIGVTIIRSLAAFIMGCSSDDSATDSDTDDDKGTITIGYNNFSETIAEVNMWKLILEDKGYQVDLKQTEKGPLFASLAQGVVDITAEVWLHATDQPYVEEYKVDIIKYAT